MTENQIPIFSMDLGQNGGNLAFYSVEEFSKWFAAERQAWQWMLGACGQDGSLNALAQAFNARWNAIQTPLNTMNQPQNKANPKPYLPQLEAGMKAAYGAGGILHSSHPEAKFIETLRQQKGDRTAAYAVALLNPALGQINTPNASAVTAVLEVELFRRGLSNNAESERKALEGLRDTWSKEFSEHRSRQDALSQEFEGLRIKTETLLVEKKDAFDKTLKEKQVDFKKQFDDWSARAQGLTDTYGAHMILQAPVDYWRSRRNKQYWTTGAVTLLTVGASIAGVCLLNSRLDHLLKNGEKLPPLPEIAYSVITISLLIWGLRILVRLLLASIHLALDAEERMVMAKTFLALVKDQAASRNEDRSHILQALFRSANTGLIKDDASPPYLQDILIKVLEKRSTGV